MRIIRIGRFAGLLLAAGTLVFAGHFALGQTPGGASPAGMNAALTRLFGTNNFTAVASVTVKDASGQQLLSSPMEFALLDGKLRVQLDMQKMQVRDMPPEAVAGMAQMGLTKVVSVIRPDKKALYIMYPDKQAVINHPFSKEEAEAVSKTPKIQKTVLGRETIEGHPTVKTKWQITTEGSAPVEAITWNATDMKEFPVQVQTTERGNTSLVLFRDIRFGRPDAKLFDLPAGFTTYTNQQQLMQGVMRGMAGQGNPPAAAPKAAPKTAPKK